MWMALDAINCVRQIAMDAVAADRPLYRIFFGTAALHSTLARRSPEVFNSVEKIAKPLIVDCSSSSLIAADPFSN